LRSFWWRTWVATRPFPLSGCARPLPPVRPSIPDSRWAQLGAFAQILKQVLSMIFAVVQYVIHQSVEVKIADFKKYVDITNLPMPDEFCIFNIFFDILTFGNLVFDIVAPDKFCKIGTTIFFRMSSFRTPNFRTTYCRILNKSHISELINVRISCFRNVKLSTN
jgi:hypothetical protein